MPIICEVNDKELNFNLDINLAKSFFEFSQADILKNILEIVNNIDIEYFNAIKKNKKILGQVRIKLIEKIDQIIVNLYLLNNNVTENKPEDFSLENIDNEIFLKIEKKMNGFTSKGDVKENDLKLIGTFNHFFIIVKSDLNKLFLLFKKIVAKDKDIKILLKSFYLLESGLIYKLVLLRYKMKICLIEK